MLNTMFGIFDHLTGISIFDVKPFLKQFSSKKMEQEP
jgi:hypothetical protein